MSRYLKDVSAVKYRFKKFFNQQGLYSIQIPNPIKNVKSIVFGGGGCSCTYSICSCTLPQTGQCCCYCCVRGHYSGAGAGFTEKVWPNVGGAFACVCVAGAEGTSFVCFAGQGCIMATGGTSGVTGTCNAGGYRIQCGGTGIGGDVNTCGAPGYFRCTSYFCRKDVIGTCCCATNCAGFCASACSCYYSDIQGVHLPGGAPGNSICNQTRFSDPGSTDRACAILRCCCYWNCWGYNVPAANNGGDQPSIYYYQAFAGYYCTKCAYTGDLVLSCTNCSIPGFCWGFPIWYCTTSWVGSSDGQSISATDPYYDYSWDVFNTCCCACCRAECQSGVGTYGSCNASSTSFGTDRYYCCYWACYCYVQRSNETATSTALGSPGYGCTSPGQVGGGGAGMWNGDETRSVSCYDRAGSCGLVVLHY